MSARGLAAMVCAAGAVAAGLFATARPSAQRVAVTLHASALEPESVRGLGQAATAARLRSRIVQEGFLRVIVGVHLPGLLGTQAVNPDDLNEAFARRIAIGQTVQRVLGRLPPQRGRIRHFETIPFVAMSVDLAGFESLLADPEVSSIQESFEVAPTLAQSVPLVQADQAWAQGFTGSGKAVAILDTGVDSAHSAFGGRVVSEACYSGDGLNTSLCPGGADAETGAGTAIPCTFHGGCFHGTHVAGIAAGSTGVARSASIIAVQVFSRTPASELRASSDDIIAGLERVYLLRSSFSIAAANLSLGGGQHTSTCDGTSPATTQIIEQMRAAGIATVVASGNDGFTSAISWPACISSAVSVGNTTKSDVVSSSSNSASFLNLLAPGTSITAPIPGGGFGVASGTSMAAPHVTGAWAILKHKMPLAAVSTALIALQTTGLSITDGRNGLSFKRIRINDALGALTGQKAQLVSPAPGATLTSSTVTFQWTAGSGVAQYWLYVGNTPGSFDLLSRNMGTALSTVVNNLPTDGRTLYVRLFSHLGTWQWNDYTFKAVTQQKAQLTSPVPGSTLTSSTVTFQWTAGSGVAQYWLYVGSTPGSFDLVSRNMGTQTSTVVSSLPTDGRTLYVRMFSHIGTWQWNDYTLTAPQGAQKAQLVSPAAGSTLTSSTVTFQWTSGSGVVQYWLYVGSTPGGFDLLSRNVGTALSTVVSSLPTDGRTLYVRLFSHIGTWQWNDYTLTALQGAQKAQLVSPAPGSVLTSATVTFQWTAGSGVAQYWLYIGSTLGGFDVVSRNMGTGLSTVVGDLPTDGRTLYVRVYSHIGAWQWNDYTVTAITLQFR